MEVEVVLSLLLPSTDDDDRDTSRDGDGLLVFVSL